MSTASEDMAEVFSFLIAHKEQIENKALNDQILTNKILFIKDNLLRIHKKFLFN